MPLMISDRMSVSSSALFTGVGPPRPLTPPLHRFGDDLVQLVGGVPHRAEQRGRNGGAGPGRLLLDRTEQQARGLGHRVIDGSEAAAMHGSFNRRFEVDG